MVLQANGKIDAYQIQLIPLNRIIRGINTKKCDYYRFIIVAAAPFYRVV